MGLLDDFAGFIKTPEGQGLLSGLSGWAAGARRGTPFNNIGRGGLAGLMGYGNALEQQMQAGQAEQAKSLRDMQMKQMQQQLAQAENIKRLARNSVLSPESQAIGKFGPTPEGADAISQFKPRFDTERFLSGMMAEDPLKAMELMKKDQKPLITVGEGQTIYDPNKGTSVFTGAPKKSPLDIALDAAGVTDPTQRAQFATKALEKYTSHAPAASTVVKLPPMQTKFQEAVGKQEGEDYAAVQKAGFAASGTINNLGRMKSLMEGMETGKLAPLGKDIAGVAASFGITIDDKLPQKEAVAALSNEMALKAKNSGGENMMPGAMSDPDRRFLVEMVPGLANTPGGNKIIIETLDRKAKRDIEVAKMARAYTKKNGTMDGFSDQLAAWSEKTPLFSDLAKKTVSGFRIVGTRPAGSGQ